MVQSRNSLFLLLCLAYVPAGAADLYKSISPSGVVEFSDRKTRSDQTLQTPYGGAPSLVEQAPSSEEKLRTSDPAVQRANVLVDLAERALAVARRPLWTVPEPGRMMTSRATRADLERVEFYKRDFREARRALLDVLQQRRAAAMQEVLTASYEVPVSRP